MPKRTPITVNEAEFKTKKSLREHIRKILYSYSDGQILNTVDFTFMLALLERHEDPKRKIGCGVDFMYVKKNPVFKNMGFWLARTDGTETDFSFEICLKHETKLQKFKSSCRSAVSDDIISFRDEFFSKHETPICEVTGEPINKWNSHVDHAPPMTFDNIVKEFVMEFGIDVEKVPLLTAEDGRVRNELADEFLRNQFRLYHLGVAELRVISKLANLSIVKRQAA
jgi:hypothetical protein